MKTPAQSLPWERLPDESDRAWSCFRRYREIGTPLGPLPGARRTVPRLLGLLEGEPNVPGAATLKGWCTQWRWLARARAYDRHLDRIALDTTETTLRDMHRRHVRLAMKLQDVAGVELAKMAAEARRAAGRVDGGASPGELVRYAEQGVKLERLARGESTETVEGRLDLSQLSLDELQTLKKLRNKAK